MPRAAKRQAPQAAGDQAYGAAGEQLAAQAQMPLPDVRSAPAPSPGGPAAGPGGGATPPAGNPLEAVLAAAQGMPAPPPAPWAGEAVLDEPITHGLPTGPGPGPEALGMARAPRIGVAEMMRRVAEVTGNPYYAELAQDAETFTP